MPFRVIRNDITKVEADAIVNTANPRPVVGGGTDYAIHKVAGPELLAERQKIGDIAIGCSVATPAFQLPAKFVLHTVSPAWIDGKHDEEVLLRKAYDAALNLAAGLDCRSVAFPLMAAGTYAFPLDQALSIAIAAFTDFLLDHEMLVYLVLFNAKAFGLAGSIFDDLKSYIDDNYIVSKYGDDYYRTYGHPEARRRRLVEQQEKIRRRRDLYEHMENVSVLASSPPPPSAVQAPSSMSLQDFLDQHEATFSEYLVDLLKERGGKDSDVYKRAEISRQLFSKIKHSSDYRPTKDTAIQLAIGLQLDLAQTQKFLGKAGYALTRSSRSDLVVQYYIDRKIYNVTFINEALWDCGLPPLRTGLVS